MKSSNVFDYIYETCCAPVEDKELICAPNTTGPKFIQLKRVGCAPNKEGCDCCGILPAFQELSQCPIWKRHREVESEKLYHCNIWEEQKIPGSTNKQMVMTSKSLTFGQMVTRFIETLDLARKHFALFKWCNHQRLLMQVKKDPRRAATVCSDYGAVMDLNSPKTDNNNVPPRVIRAIYFTYRRVRDVTYDMHGNEKVHIGVRCDVRHYFGTAKPMDKSGGKSQDTCFQVHCTYDLLRDLEKEREVSFDEDGNPVTCLYDLWSDNCGGQYKNRYYFHFIAKINEFFPGRYLRIAHHFGRKYRFKGPWDADGRVEKGFQYSQALKDCPIANGTELLRSIRASKHQFTTPKMLESDPEYREYIEKRSPKVMENSIDTINTRDYRFASDEINRFRVLRSEFGNNVIHVDRARWKIEMECSRIAGTQGYYSIIGPMPGEFQLFRGRKKYKLICRTSPCGCNDCTVGKFEDCKYNNVWYSQDIKYITGKWTHREIQEKIAQLPGGSERPSNKECELFENMPLSIDSEEEASEGDQDDDYDNDDYDVDTDVDLDVVSQSAEV